MFKMRTAGAVMASAALAALAGGCAGHGKYTGAFKDEAQQRMTGMKAATEFDMARQQFLAGDLDKALKSVDISLSLNPDVARAHLLKGRILFEQSRLELALDSFKAALAVEPSNAEAMFYQGVVHERFSDADEALAFYTQAAGADPSNAQYVIAQAEMLIELERLEDAVTLLNESKDRFRYNAGVRQTLGHIAMMRGDAAGAAEFFEEACLLAPDETNLIEDLARAQLAAGDTASAASNLELMIARLGEADRPDLVQMHAECLIELDRPVEARAAFRDLMRRPGGENDPRVWCGLGSAALILKDWHGVREAGQRLVNIAPRMSDGYMFLALHQRAEGNVDQALRSLARAAESADDPVAPALLQAVMLDELDRGAEAVAALDAALARDPGNVEAASLRTRLAAAHGTAMANVEVTE